MKTRPNTIKSNDARMAKESHGTQKNLKELKENLKNHKNS